MCWKPGQQKQTPQKAHAVQSQIPKDLWLGRKSSLPCLEGHTANKILIPLQSLVSCFLNKPANRHAAEGVPGCSEGSTTGYALVAVAQAGGGSSVPNFLCVRDQANENCEHRSGI